MLYCDYIEFASDIILLARHKITWPIDNSTEEAPQKIDDKIPRYQRNYISNMVWYKKNIMYTSTCSATNMIPDFGASLSSKDSKTCNLSFLVQICTLIVLSQPPRFRQRSKRNLRRKEVGCGLRWPGGTNYGKKRKNRLPLYALDQLRITRNVTCLEVGDVE